jgi:hypothetical protein
LKKVFVRGVLRTQKQIIIASSRQARKYFALRDGAPNYITALMLPFPDIRAAAGAKSLPVSSISTSLGWLRNRKKKTDLQLRWTRWESFESIYTSKRLLLFALRR